jgi:hypothetical protein
VPLAPATLSVWQLPHPFEEKTCLPSAIAAAFPPEEEPPDDEPPDDEPPLDGVDAGVDAADERAAVETVGFSPTELALLVVLPAATITTTITTMPTTVPRRAATRTLIMARGLYLLHPAIYRMQGMAPRLSNAEVESRCSTNATSKT